MTWDEFKNHIETKLEEQGITGNVKVGYINVENPYIKYHKPIVSFDKENNEISILYSDAWIRAEKG